MNPVKILLVFGIVFSFYNNKIESVYHKFFEYGDKNNDGKLDLKNEALENPNQAYVGEWKRLAKMIPMQILEQTISSELPSRELVHFKSVKLTSFTPEH